MSNARLGFKPKVIALSVAACFSLSATQASANPTGGTVSSGSASFASSGNTLTVTNSANAIINWQSFSIGVNDITRFLQSSSSSAVLNRVVGAGGVIPQSVIDGVLSSNGRVFLLNSSGIAIGASARIDVAGFVASSLNLSDQDFLAGRMRFTETPGAGGVSNAGVIDTTSGGPGGRVFLVGPDVQNSGVIRTPGGEIVLAAGKAVDLVSENSPFVTVSITADSERALNVGQLLADSGRIGMFGALVRQGGVAEANSAVVGANGEIRLVATRDLTLDAGSVTSANGPSGGNVTLQAQGGTNLISGAVEAKGDSGQGGTVHALGVRVGLVGKGVIDASGDTGGGTVLVGGDYHGGNPGIQNAQQTIVGSDGIIRADAGRTGDGGRVIVWADESTKFFGGISARGGAQGGDGGFVETSGKTLQAFGSVDTSAPGGKAGTWLLDPDTIQIIAGGNAPLGCATLPFAICFDDTPVGGTSQIAPGTIDAGLRTNGFVTLQAHKDIDLLADLSLTVGGTFNAQAGNNINLGAFNITGNGTTINLSANDAASLTASGTGSITSTAGFGNISTNGGSVNLQGVGVSVGAITTGGALSSAGGVAVAATGDIATGAISAQSTAGYAGANVDLASSGGKVTVNGSIITNGTSAGSVTISAAGDVASGSITTQSGGAGFASGFVDLLSTGGKVSVNGNIIASGVSGSTGGFVDGSSGGDVTVQGAGAVGIAGGIVTSGGDGVTPVNGGQGGSGAGAGAVFISGGGDAVVQGGIAARGGNGAAGTSGGLGGAGGSGGAVIVSAGGNVSVGAGYGAIDVSGGAGGLGSAASGIVALIPAANGGAGGSAGIVELVGQNVTVYGTVLAKGGAGGSGGDGIAASPFGGAGGAGGGGGLVIMSAQNVVTTDTIAVDGGAGGAGGAYGGAGGLGGSALAFVATAPLGQIAQGLSLASPAAGASVGSVIIDAPTLVLNPGSTISAKGGLGGAGGAGNGLIGGAGGNGGNGGDLILFTFSAVPSSALSVLGGAGGAGGAGTPAGAGGLAGVDGLIEIGRDITNPEAVLAGNSATQATNQLALANNAPSADELRKREEENKKKKEAAACK